MKYKKLISFLAFFLAVLSVYGQNPFILKSGEPVTIACGNSEEEVVHTALNLLNRDVESVFSTRIIVTPESKKGMIIVGTIGQSDLIDKAGVDLSPIKNKKEAFLLAVSSTGKLVIPAVTSVVLHTASWNFTVDRRFSMGVVGRCDPCKERDFSTTGFLSEYAVSFCRISGDFYQR